MEEFEKYLLSKKIDSELFKKGEPDLWKSFNELFYKINPKSFTSQKLFLINKIRRKYQYKKQLNIPKERKKDVIQSHLQNFQLNLSSEIANQAIKPAPY